MSGISFTTPSDQKNGGIWREIKQNWKKTDSYRSGQTRYMGVYHTTLYPNMLKTFHGKKLNTIFKLHPSQSLIFII